MGVNDTPRPPADLGETIARAATARRPANAPHPLGSGAASPTAAMWQTAQELYGLLSGLTPEQWSQPTRTEYGNVKDLVAHLIGVERYCVAAAAHRDDPLTGEDAAHTLVGRADIERLRDVAGAEVAGEWFDAAANTAAVLAGGADQRPIDIHGLSLTTDLALVFRAFELWAHMEDVCAAVGRSLPRLDGPRMGLMAATLVGALPAFFTDPDDGQRGRVARLVLLGPGGGVADLPLDPAAAGAAASVRLVADVVDFCRVASRRLPIDDLDRRVSGEPDLITPVLAATASFALD